MSNKADYNWQIPQALKIAYQGVLRAARSFGWVERGQAQRYFMERAEQGDSLEQLKAHAQAPAESCPCYVCNGGAKLAFRLSGDTMTRPIQEAVDSCGGCRVHPHTSSPLAIDLSATFRAKEPRWGG